MSSCVTELGERDLSEVAALHRLTLPDSTISLCGPTATHRYYARMLRSSTESLFVARGENHVVGVCVMSSEPGALLRRTVAAAPMRWCTDIVLRAMRSSTLRRRVLALAQPQDLPASLRAMPEVVQLFVARRARGMGVAGGLLDDVSSALGGRPFYVKTLDRKDNPALEFYRRRGFSIVHQGQAQGRGFAYLTALAGGR